MNLTITVPPNDLGDVRTGGLERRQLDSRLSSPRADPNLLSPQADSQLLSPRTDSHLLSPRSPRSPRTFPNIGWGVDVEAAEADFQRLSRWFMLLADPASRRRRPPQPVGDLEEAGDIDDDTGKFNLEDHLRGYESADQGSERRPKNIGVLWQDLIVSAHRTGGDKKLIMTFPDAVVGFFNVVSSVRSLFELEKRGPEFNILKGFSGVTKPGEMVLVLGRSGSGCTTFLKVIANQRAMYSRVRGQVMYGKSSAVTFSESSPGEAIYNSGDDIIHHPTLTVGQTIGFALSTRVTGKRPAGMPQRHFKDSVLKLLLKMFNIEHTINAIVGSPLIHGISSGERKRLTVAEMMATKASVCCWDNSNRGLDASAALDYVKSLRIMTDLYKTATFVSLSQASESVYAQFDRVLVIDEGREVFFGPANEARPYFERLGFLPKPRQTTLDYITGCTDIFEREIAPGRNPSRVPSNSREFEEAFRRSPQWVNLGQEMKAYRKSLGLWTSFSLKTGGSGDKCRDTPQPPDYTIPFRRQVWALMQRQFLIKWQDRFTLVSWLMSMSVAMVLATLYFNLPKTSAGAFTRGGLLFICLLFNVFQPSGELASTVLDRPIVNKHKIYKFYRPAALWIAQIGVDLLFAGTQILVFSLIVYFMCGLKAEARVFLTFWLIIITSYICMTLLFRTVGCLCSDLDRAVKFTVVVISLLVLTSGYLIPSQAQGKWISWTFYVNSLGLGFSSLMMNEFNGLTLKCNNESLVPSGAGYGDLQYQTCTLPGSSVGSRDIDGSVYINHSFRYDPRDLWRNIGIIGVLIVVLLSANVLLGELLVHAPGGRTVTHFVEENEERLTLNRKLAGRKEKREKRRLKWVPESDNPKLNIASRSILTWENLTCEVPKPSGKLRILKEIYGYVRPGQLTAIMGASGAGKTTLLDVLASRKNVGVITGDVLVNGKPKVAAFQRGIGYAERFDTHEPAQTVREALRFSAYLRRPYEISKAEKDAYVEEVIALLEMEDIADAIIGDATNGLAARERKRVTIGVELAAKPRLLLFLDELTSGLDHQSAFQIVRLLKKLAKSGQAILCTIHQPSWAMFQSFDQLLLLKDGGECVYFGDIGKDASVLLRYFAQNGAHCPPDSNPADWVIDAIGDGNTPAIGSRDWVDVWRYSPELSVVKAKIWQMKGSVAQAGPVSPADGEEYATPLTYQIWRALARMNISFWRTPDYGLSRLFNHVSVALLTSLVYLLSDNSRSSLQSRVFIIFQVTVLPTLILAQVELKYALSRLVFYREQSTKMYSHLAFALSMVGGEAPYSILCAALYFTVMYFPSGLNPFPSRAGYQLLMILACEFFGVTLGQAIAAITPNPLVASLLNPPIIVILALFCGVAIPPRDIPLHYDWMYKVDPFSRLISGMLSTELHSRPVICAPAELIAFAVPPGQTCESATSFASAAAPGYMRNLTATETCEYCPFAVGDEFLEPLGMAYDRRWLDLGVFVAFVGVNLVVLVLAVGFFSPPSSPFPLSAFWVLWAGLTSMGGAVAVSELFTEVKSDDGVNEILPLRNVRRWIYNDLSGYRNLKSNKYLNRRGSELVMPNIPPEKHLLLSSGVAS